MRMNTASGTMEPLPTDSEGLLGQAQHVLEEFVARHPSTAQDALAFKLEMDAIVKETSPDALLKSAHALYNEESGSTDAPAGRSKKPRAVSALQVRDRLLASVVACQLSTQSVFSGTD
jgi:hypothetical protein